jgi:hypothetical protein
MLAYGFTENYQFGAKADQNFVFPSCDPILETGYTEWSHI